MDDMANKQVHSRCKLVSSYTGHSLMKAIGSVLTFPSGRHRQAGVEAGHWGRGGGSVPLPFCPSPVLRRWAFGPSQDSRYSLKTTQRIRDTYSWCSRLISTEKMANELRRCCNNRLILSNLVDAQCYPHYWFLRQHFHLRKCKCKENLNFLLPEWQQKKDVPSCLNSTTSKITWRILHAALSTPVH